MQFDVIVSGMMVVDILTEVPSQIKSVTKHEVSKIIIQGGACNVDTSLLINNPDFQPAIAVVEVNIENGDRTVFYSTNNYKPLQPKDINEDWMKNSRLLLVDGYDVVGNLALLKIAKKHNIPSVIDIETGDIHILKEMISLGSHTILPLEGAQKISQLKSAEECLFYLSSITNGQLVITDGANGSWALENGKIIHQPAFPTKVIDTTGCGDAFHGAYAAALLKGKNLVERMEYASVYASIIATHFGGRSYFPNTKEVEQILLKK